MALADRIAALKGGLRISNRGNNQDFWGISWGRPTAFIVLALFADLRFVTPNLLTHVSNALFVAGSLLILPELGSHWILAAVLLNLSLSFDCADGQLARYRGGGSELGSFYDKVSDALALVLLFSVLGWTVTQETGELKFFLFAMLAASGQLVSGYAKWVCMTALHKRGHAPPAADDPVVPLWQYPLRIALKVFRFAEPDLLFWVGLGLLFERLDLALWLAFLTQPPVAAAAVIYRTLQVARSDARAKSQV
jgi:phosphatidylglycerophosphate synthase